MSLPAELMMEAKSAGFAIAQKIREFGMYLFAIRTLPM
jgi:hypothetical protein